MKTPSPTEPAPTRPPGEVLDLAPAGPEAALARLSRLHPKIIDLSLGRMNRLLSALGAPQRAAPPTIHVAGTNGKGSTIAFLDAMLRAAGYRAHAYTSPHLVRFNERIRLDGRAIADGDLLELLERCEAANGGEPITFFEITTAAALLAFAEVPADVLLLETGLGGRLDATNVIDRPLATAITPVSFDHMQFLGATLTEIAFEKAGVQKPGAPCLCAPQADDARAVIDARAAAVGAPIFHHGRDWTAALEGDGFVYRSARTCLTTPPPALEGAFQAVNAGLALAVLDHAPSLEVGRPAKKKGLRTARWPARMQRLTKGPLVKRLPADWELWLDGGHNEGAGEVIAAHVETWRDRPLHLVFGMLETKDPKAYLDHLAAVAQRLVAVAIPGEKASMTAQQACAGARAAGMRADAAPSLAAALDKLPLGAPARVLICGSLYLAGRVLAENG